MPIPELQKFRQKYPEYNDMNDVTLATKLASKYPEYSDLLEKTKILQQTQSTSIQQQPQSNWFQSYLQNAQPAFKLAVLHPETMIDSLATGQKGYLSPEELYRQTHQSWADVYRQSNLPFSRSSRFLPQLGIETAGTMLDFGTKPSSYVGAYAGQKIPLAMARNPATRRWLQIHTPTLSKWLLEANPVEPVYKEVGGMKVDITKPLPQKSEWLTQQAEKLVGSIDETLKMRGDSLRLICNLNGITPSQKHLNFPQKV